MSSSAPTFILTVSIAEHLVGHSVEHVLDQAWSSPDVSAPTRSRLENFGFNLRVDGNAASIDALKKTLASQRWNGIIVGWCIRSHPEFTELFELVMRTCFDFIEEERANSRDPKIMFCSGPKDLVHATLRSFPGH